MLDKQSLGIGPQPPSPSPRFLMESRAFSLSEGDGVRLSQRMAGLIPRLWPVLDVVGCNSEGLDRHTLSQILAKG